MPKMFMVNSIFVCRACYVNMALLAVLLLLTFLQFSPRTGKLLSVLQILLNIVGIFYNIFVLLKAERKLESFAKIKDHHVNEAKRKLDMFIGFVVISLRTALLARCSIFDNIQEFIRTNLFSRFPIALKVTRTVQRNEKASRPQQALTRESYLSPDLNSSYHLKPVLRPQSDPIKKIQRTAGKDKSTFIRAQSPELFKNKIYKSRMNVRSDVEH